jgi:hypothetical protein
VRHKTNCPGCGMRVFTKRGARMAHDTCGLTMPKGHPAFPLDKEGDLLHIGQRRTGRVSRSIESYTSRRVCRGSERAT